MNTRLRAMTPYLSAKARQLGLTAAVLLAPIPSHAAVDCEKLKTTKEPFQLVTKQGERSAAMQVLREGDGVTIALVAAGDVVVKQRFKNGFLAFSRRESPKEDLRLQVENTVSGDAYGKKQSFSYDEKITSSGIEGVPPFAMLYSTDAVYKGEEDLTVSGCTFHVLHYQTSTKTSESTLQAGDDGGQKHNQVTVNDKLYSPDLQTVLSYKTQLMMDGREVKAVSFTPTAIETSFDPIKDPGD